MGDSIETWKAMKGDPDHKERVKQESRERKARNKEYALERLKEHRLGYRQFSDTHFLVGNSVDYWPTTGKFKCRITKKSGRGIRNLLKLFEIK